MIRQLVYISTSRSLDFSPEAPELLDRARRKNAVNGLTGVLIFSNGSFLQALEGPEDVVQATFDAIAKDPRHHSVIILLDHEVETRSFPDWWMGWQHLSPKDPLAAQIRKVAGLEDMHLETKALDPSVKILIDSFLATNARPIGP
ncbi:MAG: BLUF domain-containing protein [Pseudomonadota bacterium]